jgi:hypothetical protein
MSNRITKGKAIAGKFASDKPGFPEVGGITITTAASTVDATTGFSFSSSDVLENVYVKVTTATAATSGLLNLGLLSTWPQGFAANLPVNTTGIKALWAVSTSGSTPYVFYSATYLGVFLGAIYTGTTEGSTGNAAAGGVRVVRAYNMDTTSNTTLSYSLNTTGTFAAVVYPVFHTLNS